MTVTLPTETEQLVAAQIRSGRFTTAEEVVTAAVAQLSRAPAASDVDDEAEVWDESLDADDLAAIAEADAEAERGEVFTPEQAREELLGPLRVRS